MSKRFKPDKRAFTLVEALIAVTIIVVLLAVAIPNFSRHRQSVNHDKCISNLRQIKAAREQWALENKKNIGDACTAADLDPYLHDDIWNEVSETYTTGHELVCPDDPNGASATFGTSYSINNYGTLPSCNIYPDGQDGVGGTRDDHKIQ